MTSASHQPLAEENVDLKDPGIAALLGWLVPGLGHWYQGRRAKAILYFVCIFGIFVYGLALGSSNQPCMDGKGKIGYGRAVYFPRLTGDHWLAYACQIGVGLPTVPLTLIQASRMGNNQKVWFGGFMAPPRVSAPGPRGDANSEQPTAHDIHRRLHAYFELATFFTMVAGLLNVLAVYDAFAGPVASQPAPKKADADRGKPSDTKAE